MCKVTVCKVVVSTQMILRRDNSGYNAIASDIQRLIGQQHQWKSESDTPTLKICIICGYGWENCILLQVPRTLTDF